MASARSNTRASAVAAAGPATRHGRAPARPLTTTMPSKRGLPGPPVSPSASKARLLSGSWARSRSARPPCSGKLASNCTGTARSAVTALPSSRTGPRVPRDSPCSAMRSAISVWRPEASATARRAFSTVISSAASAWRGSPPSRMVRSTSRRCTAVRATSPRMSGATLSSPRNRPILAPVSALPMVTSRASIVIAGRRRTDRSPPIVTGRPTSREASASISGLCRVQSISHGPARAARIATIRAIPMARSVFCTMNDPAKACLTGSILGHRGGDRKAESPPASRHQRIWLSWRPKPQPKPAVGGTSSGSWMVSGRGRQTRRVQRASWRARSRWK